MINLVDVVRIRYFVRAALRLTGVLMFAMSISPAVSWFIEGFVDEDFFDLYYYADRITSVIVFIVAGVLLIFLNKSLAQLLVPLPQNECPRCGYSLRQLVSASCPECGLYLERKELPEAGDDSLLVKDDD